MKDFLYLWLVAWWWLLVAWFFGVAMVYPATKNVRRHNVSPNPLRNANPKEPLFLVWTKNVAPETSRKSL